MAISDDMVGRAMHWHRLFRRDTRLSVLAHYRKDQIKAADQHVLAEAVHSGIDTSRPQEVRHYLYLPSAEDAHHVAEALGADRYAVEVRKSASLKQNPPNPWLVLAARSAVLDETRIEETRRRFEALALRCKGDYDGWEIALRHSSREPKHC